MFDKSQLWQVLKLQPTGVRSSSVGWFRAELQQSCHYCQSSYKHREWTQISRQHKKHTWKKACEFSRLKSPTPRPSMPLNSITCVYEIALPWCITQHNNSKNIASLLLFWNHDRNCGRNNGMSLTTQPTIAKTKSNMSIWNNSCKWAKGGWAVYSRISQVTALVQGTRVFCADGGGRENQMLLT